MRLSPKYITIQTEPTTAQKKAMQNEKAYQRKLALHSGKKKLIPNPKRIAEEAQLAEMMEILGMDDADFMNQYGNTGE